MHTREDRECALTHAKRVVREFGKKRIKKYEREREFEKM
jgi:hypothetical protein